MSIKGKSYFTLALLFFLALFLSSANVSAADTTNDTTLSIPQDSTSYGYVEKEFYGNQTSNQSIVLIVGVHPLENGIHAAIADVISNKSSNLSKRYVLYTVHVTQDANDYSKGRMNGQLLAQQFIVPNVSSENLFLAVDIHENNYQSSGYTYYRFLYLISNTAKTSGYADQIISEMPFLTIYSPPNPTSTPYVTIPIANMGISTMVYETYLKDTAAQKASDARAFIDALDNIFSFFITATYPGRKYYAPQNVVLAAEKVSKIYYTLDGTEPNTNSSIYDAPLNISNSKTLKYFGVDNDMNFTPVKTKQYQIYVLTPYNFIVQVPLKQVWYKGWYKVAYTVKIRAGKYRVGKKWTYTYKYITRYKIKNRMAIILDIPKSDSMG